MIKLQILMCINDPLLSGWVQCYHRDSCKQEAQDAESGKEKG